MTPAQLNFLHVLQPDAAAYIVEQTKNCPLTLALVAYVNHTLSLSEEARMVEHLAECDRCRGVLADYVRLEGQICVGQN